MRFAVTAEIEKRIVDRNAGSIAPSVSRETVLSRKEWAQDAWQSLFELSSARPIGTVSVRFCFEEN